MALFLYGTLRSEALLTLTLGESSRARIQPAQLQDHAVHWAKGHRFPMILEAPGKLAEGLLLSDLSEEDLQRLDYYEGGFAYSRQTRRVKTEGGAVDASVYFPDPGQWQVGQPWSLDDWQDRLGAMALRAAAEIMDGYGQIDAATQAGRRSQIEFHAASWVRAQAEQTPQTVGHGFTKDDVEIVATRRPYGNFFGLTEQDLRFRRFDGSYSQTIERAGFVTGDAVTVLPYDAARDRVMLVEQFRFGPLLRGDRHPWSLEPIAGRIDPGEGAEETAMREAQEEAGITLQALEKITGYYPSPGANMDYVYAYVGLCDLPDAAIGIGGLESEDEDIRSLLLSFDNLMALVTSGEAQNALLLISAWWLAANRERLRSDA